MSEAPTPVTISVTLSPAQATAVAWFVRRVGYYSCRSISIDEQEAYCMLRGLTTIGAALSDAGVFAERGRP